MDVNTEEEFLNAVKVQILEIEYLESGEVKIVSAYSNSGVLKIEETIFIKNSSFQYIINYFNNKRGA